MISQLEDIPPETFCHGDNLPPNCTTDCTCTHKIDVPLNAIVEVVLVDEGLYNIDYEVRVYPDLVLLQYNKQTSHIRSTCMATHTT